MRSVFSLLLAFIFPAYIYAQENASPQIQVFKKAGEVNVHEISEDFAPRLQYLEMPKPGAESYYNYLQRIKNQVKPSLFKNENDVNELQGGLVKTAGFEIAPLEVGVPNDNDMAISNDGKIVAVQNGSFTVLDTTGKELKDVSLAAFSSTLNLKQQKYDPRVLYDPETDRFIVVILNGNDDSTNFIVFAFSTTNDPTGAWNLYTLPGDPLNDTTWSDYPIIALHNGELFLTINALQNNKSWQEGFRQSYIWQIDKMPGYEGEPLVTKLHSNNSFNGKMIRNLCPAQGGSKPANGTAYFVSTRNFSQQSDSVFLISLEGNVYNSNPVKTIKLLRSSTTYGVPPSAKQIKDSFQTNDARVLDALMQNGNIHFVGNSVTSTGKAGIFHGIIYNYATWPNANFKIISDPKLELGYPSIAGCSRKTGEDAFTIFFNHTADTIAPGNSVILYNGGSYSEITRLKNGTSYVNVMSGRQERWGDYSGAQTRYNQKGKVWVCGYYGYRRSIGGGTFQYLSGTYISEVQNASDNFPTVSVPEIKTNRVKAPLVYPSPAQINERINLEFTAEIEAYTTFCIYDMSGKLLTLLMDERVKPGKNKFSFSTGNLKAGQYILRINQQGSEVSSVKFFVR